MVDLTLGVSRDTMISERNPNNEHGSCDACRLQYDAGPLKYYPILYFDLITISHPIESATLKVYLYGNGLSGTANITINDMTSPAPFVEGSGCNASGSGITWNTSKSISSVDNVSDTILSSDSGWKSFDVTDRVKNSGLSRYQPYISITGATGSVDIVSSENSTYPTESAILEITYATENRCVTVWINEGDDYNSDHAGAPSIHIDGVTASSTQMDIYDPFGGENINEVISTGSTNTYTSGIESYTVKVVDYFLGSPNAVQITECYKSTKYFVDKDTGKDYNTGMNWEEAWKTIDRAANYAQDNTTIMIHGGNYISNEPSNNDVTPVNAGSVGIGYAVFDSIGTGTGDGGAGSTSLTIKEN